MNKRYLDDYKLWLNSTIISDEDKEELLNIKNDEKEIENRFYTDLSFGTAGMRGIRGIGKNRINIYNIRKVTQGLANYIIETTGETGKRRGVVIAYDCRIASAEFALNTALVLCANGIKSYLFKSLRSTPELSFATRELGAQAGVMITASHNPKEYNGYKVYWEDGAQIVDPQATGIVNAVNSLDIFNNINILTEDEAIKSGLLEYIDENIDNRYIQEIKKLAINTNINCKESFKIVYSPLHGTGRIPVQRVLKEMGFLSVSTVKEQEMPDGTFPTCSYANPEDKSVFKLSIELADKIGATLCLANDPDADRVGIAIKDNRNSWYYPNGNQLGVLLLDYILNMKKEIPKNAAIISTIVSTPMINVITKAKNISLFRTLTGFKYIGEKIRQFERKELDGTFLFGFEESIGYLLGTHVRDKDGIVTSLLIAEMSAYYSSIGISLYTKLLELYNTYGWFKEDTISVTKQGKSGIIEIASIMEILRKSNHENICGKKIKIYKDYKLQLEKNLLTKENKRINLPKSEVIQFVLEDNSVITVRPSGTEPKIKYYICVCDTTDDSSKEKLEFIKSQFLSYIDNLK